MTKSLHWRLKRRARRLRLAEREGLHELSRGVAARIIFIVTVEAIPALELEVAGLSHLGQVRSVNEDAWAAERVEDQVIALVADGMGGHRAGEVASALATDTLISSFRTLLGTPYDRLARAFQRANLAVYQQASRRVEARGMGTTLTCVLFDDQYLITGHVGDSRAYLLREGELRQLTRDHSWVAERVRQGLILESEARTHRWRNVITNALGSFPQVRLDLIGLELHSGDQVMLCSDGLTGVLTDEQIARAILNGANQPVGQVVEALVNQVNAGGAPDNVTVVLVRAIVVRPKPKSYTLPPPLEGARFATKDPHPDVTSTMVLEPESRAEDPQNLPGWLIAALITLAVSAVALVVILLR